MAFQPSMFLYNSRAEMHWSAGCSRALLAAGGRPADQPAQHQGHQLRLHEEQDDEQDDEQDNDLDQDDASEAEQETALNLSLHSKRTSSTSNSSNTQHPLGPALASPEPQVQRGHLQPERPSLGAGCQRNNSTSNGNSNTSSSSSSSSCTSNSNSNSNSNSSNTPASLTSHLNLNNGPSSMHFNSSSTTSSTYSSDWSSAADSLASCSPERARSISSPHSASSLLHRPHQNQQPQQHHQHQTPQQQQLLLQQHNHNHRQASRQPPFMHHHHHHHHHHELGPTHKTDSEDLDRIRNFIEQFKARRGALGLTQKQAAQCFRAYTNDRYAFSDNFVGHFEGFQFRPQTAMTIADSLAEWLEFAENETRQGRQLNFMPGKVKETRKRKYEVIRIRDSAKRVLVEAFEKNKSPSTSELEQLSRKTNIPSRNIEIFFKNRRTSRQYHQ